MKRTTRPIVLLALAAATGLPFVDPIGAVGQEAIPAPAVCDVQPRPITFIADLLAAPKPDVTPTPVAGIPEGMDATDPETRAAVVSVVETLIVCVNQGDLLRSFSLFDDEYLRRVIDPEGLMREDVAVELAKSMATPVAVDPDDVTMLEDILLVRELGDGTIAVVFRTLGGPNRDQDQSQIDLFVLRNDGEHWLIIDGVTDLDPGSVPSPTA